MTGTKRVIIFLVIGLIAIASLNAILEYMAESQRQEIASLRESNPSEYLLYVKTEKGYDEWFQELEKLDPAGYQLELQRIEDERLRKEQEHLALLEKNQKEIVKLLSEVKSIPYEDFSRNLRYYTQLSKLDPGNIEYENKRSHYKEKLDELEKWKTNPSMALEISEFRWWTDGFGSIMMIDISIKNNAPFDIKDMTLKCRHSAASGREIDSNTREIFDIFPAGRTKKVSDFNMGFIDQQVKRSGCVVLNANLK